MTCLFYLQNPEYSFKCNSKRIKMYSEINMRKRERKDKETESRPFAPHWLIHSSGAMSTVTPQKYQDWQDV